MFWSEDGAVVGDNTDVAGIARGPGRRWSRRRARGSSSAPAAAREPPRSPRRASGAAVAVALPLGGAAPARSSAGRGRRGLRTAPAAACAVVINATPLGLQRRRSAPAGRRTPCRARGVALDMVYAHGRDAVGPRHARARVAAPPTAEACWWRRAPRRFERWFPGVRASGRGHAAPRWMPRFAELRARLAELERWLLPAAASCATRRSPPREGDALICALCRSRWRPVPEPLCDRCGQPAFGDLDCRLCADWPAGLAPGPQRGLAGGVARDARSTGSSTKAGGGWRRRWRWRCGASSH